MKASVPATFLIASCSLIGSVAACSSSGTNEVGSDESAAALSAGSPIKSGLTGKCLDDQGDQTADGTKIELWDCNGTGAQSWTYRNANLVGPGGKCLDVRYDAQSNGTIVWLYTCNGTAAQKWTLDGTEIKSSGGLCLDAKGDVNADGTQVQLWSCSGAANQVWNTGATVKPDAGAPADGGHPISDAGGGGGTAAYPGAGWVPFKSGPLVTSVATMYGANPLGASCPVGYTAPSGYPKASGSQPCVLANSEAIISNLWGKNPANFAGEVAMTLGSTAYYESRYAKLGQGGGAFFESSSSDPEYDVTASGCAWKGCSTGPMHIPAGAVPQLNSDHHLEIRDLATGYDWGIWEAPVPDGKGGTYTPNGGTAASQLTATSKGIGIGGTAGAMSMLYSVRPQDILAGRIPHALSIVVTCDVSYNGNASTSTLYPVVASATGGVGDNQYFCGTPGANTGTQTQWAPDTGSDVNLAYGAHLWLDEGPQLARGAAGCDVISYAYLKAMNEFGAYVNDVGSAYWGSAGPVAINLMSDISDTYSGNPHGTTSSWSQVFHDVGAVSSATATNQDVYFKPTGTCGVNLAEHLHVLVPPPASY